VATLYRADAVELLRSVEDQSVACILTDPPYASGGFQEAQRRGSACGSIGRAVNYSILGDNMSTGGITTLLRLVAVEAARVLIPGGWLLVFCDWRMIAAIQPHLESSGLGMRSVVCWAKRSAALGVGFRSQSEYILALSAGSPNVHSKMHGNVLDAKRSRNKHHPTEKPLELRKLLEVTTTEGDMVIDPFCGSGSTGVAAVGMRRRFIGSDLDPEHLETATRRLGELCEVESVIDAPAPQPSLFVGGAS
jgi:site-specific DNA-methyltransferase (adenine-specific)